MKFFKVLVKLGHLGRAKYHETWVFVKAEDMYSALKKAQSCPAVKHDKLPTKAVMITEEEYIKGVKEDQYYKDVQTIFD